jgi:hypothetical protein
LKSSLTYNHKNYNIYAHRLFGWIYNNNNDIIRKTDCDHIDRHRWCNRPENLGWVTSVENQNKKGRCLTKIDRKHDNFDIDYLEEWIIHIKLIKIKGKDEYIKSLNNDLQLLEMK